jgi:hypothetical protein
VASVGGAWAAGGRQRDRLDVLVRHLPPPRWQEDQGHDEPIEQSTAPTTKAPLKPWVSATGSGEPEWRALVKRLVETEERIARPSEPPTCWVVLRSPEASPDSLAGTPLVAAIVIGTNDIPIPMPRDAEEERPRSDP